MNCQRTIRSIQTCMEEQSWLSWLVRGFLSERSPVRSSVTSTPASNKVLTNKVLTPVL